MQKHSPVALYRSLYAAAALLLPASVLGAALGNADDLNVGTASTTNVRQTIISVIQNILSYVTLIAVIVIIVAGIMLIVAGESQKDKVKKMILYVIIGLIIILLARAIVTFVVGVF
ncbi:MAG: TrbC/VirB2 family protein [Candidatus Peregrinibacteria bacterium]